MMMVVMAVVAVVVVVVMVTGDDVRVTIARRREVSGCA